MAHLGAHAPSALHTGTSLSLAARCGFENRQLRGESRLVSGLREMQHTRSGSEERRIAFLIGWNLSERMKRQMRGFLHVFEHQKTNVVSLAHFFERPTNAHVPRQSPATIGRLLKGGDGGVHRSLRALMCTYYRVCVSRR